MRALDRIIDDPTGCLRFAQERRVRCHEHILHLAANAFVETVYPALSGARENGKTATVEDVDEDGDDDSEWRSDINDDGDGNSDDSVDFEAGDVLSKALGLINQVGPLFSWV